MKKLIKITTAQGIFFKQHFGTLTTDRNEAIVLQSLPKDIERFKQSILKENPLWQSVDFEDTYVIGTAKNLLEGAITGGFDENDKFYRIWNSNNINK